MKIPSQALFSTAKEIAKQAENSMPKLKKGEVVKREWLKNEVYYRITVLNGVRYRAEYNFKTKKACQFKIASEEVSCDFMQIRLSE